jgi:hypothetical protein
MRFGILGPANGDTRALEDAVQLLLFQLEADQVIYLGDDSAIDQLVLGWARAWVGADASDEGRWARAAQACREASPRAIDDFIARERRRERLKDLKCLASEQRTVEMLDGRVAVLVHDKAMLDEDDILPASVLIFGKSAKPLVRQVGSRTFVSPGELRPGTGGVAMFFDDDRGAMAVSIYEPGGAVLETRVLPALSLGRVQIYEKSGPAGEPT